MLYASAARDGRSCAENGKNRGISSLTVPTSSKAATVPMGTRPRSALRHKCANCGGGHRPVSRDCPVKVAAMKEAQQALADCPAYHRVPLHFRNTDHGDRVVPETRQVSVERDDLEASIHLPNRPQEVEPRQASPPTITDLDLEPVRTERASQELVEPAKPRRGPGRPKGSRTRPKEQAPPSANVPASQRPTRSQATTQRSEQDSTGSKRRRVGEPEDTMDEQPDHRNWFDIQFAQSALPREDLSVRNTRSKYSNTTYIRRGQ